LCKDPLLNEPGVEKGHRDMTAYDEIIQFANLDIAVCDIVDKKDGVFMPFFENFYPFVRENFNKNFDKFIAFAEKKHKELGSVATDLKTGFYSMTIRADYETLIYRLKSAYAIAQIM
jgi:hypothetical protein